VSRAVKSRSLPQVKQFITACIEGRKVHEFGFGWTLLLSTDLTLELFSARFFSTRFAERPTEDADGESLPPAEVCCLEGKGLLLVDGDTLTLTDMNLTNYKKKRPQAKFNVLPGLSVASLPDKYDTNEYPELKAFCNNFLITQQSAQAAPDRKKRDYEEGDELIVRITSRGIAPYIYEAVSVDPAYNRVAGKVYCYANIFGIDASFIVNNYPGKYLKVAYQKSNFNVPFTLVTTYTKEYLTYADNTPRVQEAIYISPYRFGLQWYTECGLRVNIMGDPGYEAALAVEDNTKKLRIRLNGAARLDSNGNPVINGVYIDEEEATEVGNRAQFLEDAYLTCLDELGEVFDAGYVEESRNNPYCSVDVALYAPVIAHWLYFAGLEAEGSLAKMRCLFAAESVAELAEREADMLFIHHERSYRDCLIRFAMGEAPRELNLEHPQALNGIEEVLVKEQIVERLRAHKEESTRIDLAIGRTQRDLCNLVGDLVNASNALLGKISEVEINRIKKNIAHHLHVDDLYRGIKSDTACYGEESDTLEFKSSVVYVPGQADMAEPSRQMFNIIKVVGGFLNTTTGGDLLIGVDDSGMPVGLDRDTQYLFANKIISEPTLDKLRLHVKYHLDDAFADDAGHSGLDITTTRISYFIEKKPDSPHEILRLRVLPYEYGIVHFRGESLKIREERQTFYRTSGATVKMTAAVKKQVAAMKQRMRFADDRDIVLQLQTALADKRVVRLRSYTDAAGTSDREVEVYNLLIQRNLVVGYDRDLKCNCVYRLNRCEGAELLGADVKWRNACHHLSTVRLDPFGSLMQTGRTRVDIRLRLKLANGACLALTEAYPETKEAVRRNDEADRLAYPHIFEATVYDVAPAARFYAAYADGIKIIEGEEVKAWAKRLVEYL
jgi:hypothetical protein